MSLHQSLSPKARENRIRRDQTNFGVVASKRRAEILLIAKLSHAAMIGNDPEAREQLRILRNITVDAQETYMQGVTA